MGNFTHLHVHSQYSILDGAASIGGLVSKAKEDGMPALAITDHGTMFGIKEFHVACKKNEIKPIIGCETYVARRAANLKSEKEDRSGNHLVILAKNPTGYRNLLKLVSLANTSGMYYKPRIDKEQLEKYSEGLIISSACLGGEIPQKIMNDDIAGAEEAINWYKGIFGDDYYLEVQRHECDDPKQREEIWENQQKVNAKIIELAAKHNIKVIATNDVHFINKEDANAHDLLICLNTGKDIDDPSRMRYTKQEWFKTTAEMEARFSDIPEALTNTQEIVDKVEFFELDSAPIMPDFPLPDGFESEAEYLSHLTYEGAKVRYGDPIPKDAKERLDFELETIINMGFPGYFLIVQDFINAARDMGVLVGPGRGSAAGAAVSYCTGITNIDPIKYDLLFERFLNPDRISMPDVDIDFDDDGRQQVLDWVTEKYGKDKVAHICTFGTMAAKSAIKDCARVLKLPLPEADRLAKMVPEAPKMTLKKAYKENPELEKEKDSPNHLIAQTIKFAETLEGSVRQTGVHACGILIGKNSLDQHLPVMPTKEEELLTTQYDGRFVEDIGLLKMDFLGLRTLSIIKECIKNVKESKGIDIDIDSIPIDDIETYELFSRGETTAIFQFESPGMKKHLRNLKPNRFEDLVAMNALYRPGPMEYIPSFIARKHGKEEIVYDHPLMEKYLKDTYGITVYQEQVMLQSRELGGFTRGDSDTLRKAMGKKITALMDKLKIKFQDGCKNNPEFMKGIEGKNIDPDTLINKIWGDWEAFASYAFNKSHSVCYAHVAYQTGYLKAHYPAEFMAAVLSCNLSNMDKVTTFMDECKRMDLSVKVPDVNESRLDFAVNTKGDIRFGLAAIKGVGESAANAIIDERFENGPYKDIFDFVERVNLRAANKKNIENLAMSGAFDSLNIERFQFFSPDSNNIPFVETLIKFGANVQQGANDNAPSLFGGEDEIEIPKPQIPQGAPWSQLQTLNEEKALIGIYLSAHPLDEYKMEIKHYCKTSLNMLDNLENLNGKEMTFAGMVTTTRISQTKSGKMFGIMTLEDFNGSFEFALFGKTYETYSGFLVEGERVCITGTIGPRYPGSDQMGFNVKHIEYLRDLKKKIKGIAIKLKIEDITEELINEVSTYSDNSSNDGLQLNFLVYEPGDNIWVQMKSKKFKVPIKQDFFDYLEENDKIDFKLN